MRFALLSDIHSNIEALEAVLKDIEKEKIDEIYCLGDMVGYGPNPKEVIDAARSFKFVLLGNHDQAVIENIPEGFNSIATGAIEWTKNLLKQDAGSAENNSHLSFLTNLKKTVVMDARLFAHGSPRSNMEYIIGGIIARDVFMDPSMENMKVCFVGHTHIPGVFVAMDNNQIGFYHPSYDEMPKIGEQRLIINVGSVGQPRDGNNKACYVIVEDDRYRYQRVAYDISKTVEKIYKNYALSNFLGDRLQVGK